MHENTLTETATARPPANCAAGGLHPGIRVSEPRRRPVRDP